MWIDEGNGQLRKAGLLETAWIMYRRYGLIAAQIGALGILAWGFFKI